MLYFKFYLDNFQSCEVYFHFPHARTFITHSDQTESFQSKCKKFYQLCRFLFENFFGLKTITVKQKFIASSATVGIGKIQNMIEAWYCEAC